MKLKKLTSFTAVIALCAAMLTSCSGTANSSSAENSSKIETTTTAATTAAAVSSESESSEPENKQPSDITPAMWTITSPEGNKMVVAGSMHALKDECYPLPEKIMDVYNSADILAVECDTTNLGLSAQMSMANQMMYKDGDTLKNHISDEAYNAVKDYLKTYNADISMYDTYKPWAVSSCLDAFALNASKLNANLGFDSYFMNLAHKENKEIYEVESVDFQMDMLMNFSDDIYDVMFLAYEGETKETQTQSMLNLYEAWKKGDIEKLSEENETTHDYTEQQMKYIDDYENQMLYNRNEGMTKAIEDLLKDGKNVFYIVGAAHYVGDKGIISLLEKDGYKAERIEY